MIKHAISSSSNNRTTSRAPALLRRLRKLITAPSKAPHAKPASAETEWVADVMLPRWSAIPSRAAFPVIAEVNTLPSTMKVVTSVKPEAVARAASPTSRIAMRSVQERGCAMEDPSARRADARYVHHAHAGRDQRFRG